MCWPLMRCAAFQIVDMSWTRLPECAQFNVHTKVPHLLNWKENRNLTFVKNVNAGSNPTSVCMIVAKMNNKSLLNSGLLSICTWTVTLTTLFWRPELITLWMLLTSLNKTIYRKAKSHSPGAAWVKNHISWMRTKIHVFTKECLLGTMIIIQIYTLFLDFGLEWACVLCKHRCMSPVSVAMLSSTKWMLLIEYLLKSEKHWHNRDANKSTNVMASTSSCPRFRNKQMAKKKQNRLFWSVCPSSDMMSKLSECLFSDKVSSSTEA